MDFSPRFTLMPAGTHALSSHPLRGGGEFAAALLLALFYEQAAKPKRNRQNFFFESFSSSFARSQV
jgi:hypothetical protein